MAVDTNRLRNRRDELDLTNAEVAQQADISPGYAENIMCGADKPSRRLIFRLARVLKMPADEIDPEINAGKRTSQGDPSEPPNQPKNEPTRPPRRQDHENETKGPRRVQAEAVA
ncbi:helix-turn-helix domain-containing protein [Prauserella endophytica]|nr:helix-turn-helix transcriptional regulator [Prauserella endophytica]